MKLAYFLLLSIPSSVHSDASQDVLHKLGVLDAGDAAALRSHTYGEFDTTANGKTMLQAFIAASAVHDLVPRKTASRRGDNVAQSRYQRFLDLWIYPVIGSLKITEVSPADISALLLAEQSAGKSHSSCVKCYAILNVFFKMAYLYDIIDHNPMDKVQRPKARKDELGDDEMDAFTVDEVRYILACLEEEPLKWRAYFRLLIDTGIRHGEACGLQWRYVDFEESRITIAANLCYTASAGVYLDTPKTRKPRTIDVDPEVMNLLKALQNEQATTITSDFVFTKEGSSEPMNPQSPSEHLASFAKRYGISGLHPHKLRHTYASIAITYGADIASVSQNLGHSDKTTTLKMYTHANQESRKQASNIFRSAIKVSPAKKDAETDKEAKNQTSPRA